MTQNVKDMRGLRFGHWTVLDLPPRGLKPSQRVTAFWLCRCVCGNEKYVQGYALRYGTSTKCKTCSKRKEGSAFRSLVFKYKKSAKAKGVSFSLTEAQFLLIAKEDCFYCGAPPSNVCESKRDVRPDKFVYSGIDRRDSSLGYEVGNSVPCCWPCNRGKARDTEADFIERCKRIARRFE